MTQALERYHEFVETELAKEMSQLEKYNAELKEKKESLHVEDVVREKEGGLVLVECCSGHPRSP